MPYGKKWNIINKYDYVAVIVSKNFLQELDLLDILPENYKNTRRNKKILPIIIWEDLYEPECRDEVFDDLDKRINAYRERHKEIIINLEGNAAKELRRMQSISLKLRHFTYFAVEKDVKANLQESDKLLKYILQDRKVNVADRKNSSKNKGGMSNTIINVRNVEQLNVANDNGTINANANKEK
ncbi:MAG: hypothetical protein HDR18_07080 [Lachnospiraceae bacterium]|nr:hypothetical protein [Lachnospiraceae bacterium]